MADISMKELTDLQDAMDRLTIKNRLLETAVKDLHMREITLTTEGKLKDAVIEVARCWIDGGMIGEIAFDRMSDRLEKLDSAQVEQGND